MRILRRIIIPFVFLIGSLVLAGCTGSLPDEAPIAETTDQVLLEPRQQESQEFFGRLPAAFRGVNLTNGSGEFIAEFPLAANLTTIEISIAVDRVKAPGYIVTVSAEGEEGQWNFDGTAPFVLETGLVGPYLVTIRANGPDLEGSHWKANVTQYFRYRDIS